MLIIDSIKDYYLKRFIHNKAKEFYESLGTTIKEVEKYKMRKLQEEEYKGVIKEIKPVQTKKALDFSYAAELKGQVAMLQKENKELRATLKKVSTFNTSVAELEEENEFLKQQNCNLELRNKTLIETFSRREDIKDITQNVKKSLSRQDLIISKTLGVENDLKKLKEQVKSKQLEKSKV